MTATELATSARDPIHEARGRQTLFYSPAGLLGGMLTCSRCGAAGRQPDVIDHNRDCSYARAARPSEPAAGPG